MRGAPLAGPVTRPIQAACAVPLARSSARQASTDSAGKPPSKLVIKDLKIRGASGSVKVGTKVRSIRLIEAEDGHDIACKIDGVGAINLKSEFVKKA